MGKVEVMGIISLLVLILVCGILYWAVNKCLSAPNMPLAEPFVTFLRVIVIVILVLVVLQALLGFIPAWPRVRF